MAIQTVHVTPTIEWDDSVVFVFSFEVPTGHGGTTRFFCGFVHAQLQVATAIGSSDEVTGIIGRTKQDQVQFAADPQCWIDTVKAAFRGRTLIFVTFDDAVSTHYFTETNHYFTLHHLYSLAG